MPIKIKVNIPFDIYTCLLNDMESFEFTKEDGTVNKNLFINTLFENFFQEFSEYEDKLAKKVDEYLSHDFSKQRKKEITYNLISLINDSRYDLQYYNDFSFQFILSKKNEQNFAIVENYYLKTRSISKYFRDMFISYAARSQDKRELILFRNQYTLLSKAIKENKIIIITNKRGETTKIEPFMISRTKEELYNYLLGIYTTTQGKRKVSSRKLYKLEGILVTDQNTKISEQEKYLLSETAALGAQFPVTGDTTQSVVSLTRRGMNLFKNMYLNRPTPTHREGNVLFFDCTFEQLEFYFFKFGEDAMILEPESLKKRFFHKYLMAMKQYSTKK